jgi:hypothetical protein
VGSTGFEVVAGSVELEVACLDGGRRIAGFRRPPSRDGGPHIPGARTCASDRYHDDGARLRVVLTAGRGLPQQLAGAIDR